LQKLEPQLHLGTYTCWYCVPCETRWTLSDFADPDKRLCPTCQRPVEEVTEEDFFLDLESHRGWLKAHLLANPRFIQPESRRNEIAALLERPLPELCVTRPKARVPWGIPVRFAGRYQASSGQHVVYVWFDALVNYISALGWPDGERFHRYWEEAGAIHLIGKDILRHHALYWPIILRALGLPPPRRIIAHGWWKVGEQKMSKSRGNIVDPYVVTREVLKAQPHAADVYRYFLLREIPFGQDGAFSEEALLGRLSADLANDLGNLVHRTLSMVERYCHGKIPPAGTIGCAVDDEPLRQEALTLGERLDEAMDVADFSQALEAVFQLVTHANQYIETQAPWQLAKESQPARLHAVLNLLAEVIRVVAIALEPFMPMVSQAIWEQLGMAQAPRQLADVSRWPGLVPGQPLGARRVLFPRTEAVTS
jgi:methionyl-tRNA synthetase